MSGLTWAKQNMVPQPPKTFDRFLQLPAELRLMIWESVARGPDVPSVHFFSLWNSTSLSTDPPREPLLFPEAMIGPKSPWKSPWNSLGPPNGRTASSQRGHSWLSNNASAYLIDMGLWTACSESRTVMQNLYRDKTPIPLVTRGRLHPPPDACTAAWIPYKTNGARQKVIMSFGNDLICLTNLLTQSKGGWRETVHPAFSVFPRRLFLYGASHLGLPYDPKWDTLSRNPSSADRTAHWDYLSTHIRCIVGPSKIWFIDYRIKINSSGLECQRSKGCLVFQGNGLRLVEIREPGKGDRDVARGRKALDFINIFDEICESLRSQWQPFHTSSGKLAELGVLACVYDKRG